MSAALFATGLVLATARLDAASQLAANAGVLALLATPVAGLVVTALELRALQPRSAMLALVLLGILGLATVLALLSR